MMRSFRLSSLSLPPAPRTAERFDSRPPRAALSMNDTPPRLRIRFVCPASIRSSIRSHSASAASPATFPLRSITLTAPASRWSIRRAMATSPAAPAEPRAAPRPAMCRRAHTVGVNPGRLRPMLTQSGRERKPEGPVPYSAGRGFPGGGGDAAAWRAAGRRMPAPVASGSRATPKSPEPDGVAAGISRVRRAPPLVARTGREGCGSGVRVASLTSVPVCPLDGRDGVEDR